jgi:hypothetical protein
MCTEDIADADTVVLIHGLWMTPRSWEHWIPRLDDDMPVIANRPSPSMVRAWVEHSARGQQSTVSRDTEEGAR